MSRIDAVDVSRYQGAPDWAAVHANTAGTLAIWKATQGTSWVDPQHPRNRAETARAGFTHRVMYHWVTPADTAAAQAAHVLATVGTLAAGEGIMLDVEQDGVTADLALDVAHRIEAATGRPVCVYTGVYFAGGSVWRDQRIFDGTRPRLLAAYVTEDRARKAAAPYWCDLWQWTSSATVPGITGRVDANRIDNLTGFDAVCGLTAAPAPQPPLEDDDMAMLVQPNDGDEAVLLVAAGVARWVRDGNELDRLRIIGQAPTDPPKPIDRSLLRDLILAGPPPTYPANYAKARTYATDFGSAA